jgi:hypothetical protein
MGGFGSAEEDVLIAGPTGGDRNDLALQMVLQEWTGRLSPGLGADESLTHEVADISNDANRVTDQASGDLAGDIDFWSAP